MLPSSNILFIIAFFSYLFLVNTQNPSQVYPTPKISTLWINKTMNSFTLDTSGVRILLVRGSSFGPEYACGFYCSGDCHSYLFAVLILPTNDTSKAGESSQVVWSANRNNPVGINATLELTAEGDLVLTDADGSLAWSTYTSGRWVAGLNLTEMGNLVLFDARNSVVWQSFDHLTDALVPGQILVSGQKLTASEAEGGNSYSVSMIEQGLVASILSDPPREYLNLFVNLRRNKETTSYAKFQNGSLSLYINPIEPPKPDIKIPIPPTTSAQYMKLGDDGHLRVFEWVDPSGWRKVTDIFEGYVGDCGYPMVCGKYGICSSGQCSCPGGKSFSQTSERHPDLGCSEVIPLTCDASENRGFLDLHNVTYTALRAESVEMDLNSCKEACLKICSCRAAIFRYSVNASRGECYTPSQIFTLMENDRDSDYIYTASIKVQVAPNVKSPGVERAPSAAKGKAALSLLGALLGSSLGVICIAGLTGAAVFVHRRRSRKSEEVEEDYLDQVPGMPMRFSLEELASATENFSKKLGEGGFGSVFEGSFSDGTRIAVKRLDGVGHVKKSFLAEVQTIGSIHHVNLVRLIGFCAEKSHRLLVYEYMCNGSLDGWIYCQVREKMLDWNYRRRIILDIAKGLAYLHEECRQKIIHLDIKPQNILLDEQYNAKLADFGLSKLIDRNQSEVVTTMRGTPGYLAPEWLSAIITEKVDVYSFGVVILEIVCGRKIFELSRPEDERYLLALFRKKAEEGQWLDLTDKCCQDVQSNVAQIEEMLRIAAWCLQNEHEKRPCMSTVIKVLEGVNVQRDINYNFLIPDVNYRDVTSLIPWWLSGPR